MGPTVLMIQDRPSPILNYVAFPRHASLSSFLSLRHSCTQDLNSLVCVLLKWEDHLYCIKCLCDIMLSLLLGGWQGTARHLFQKLQGPLEEDTIKSHFEKIISVTQKLRPRKNQVASFFFLSPPVF